MVRTSTSGLLGFLDTGREVTVDDLSPGFQSEVGAGALMGACIVLCCFTPGVLRGAGGPSPRLFSYLQRTVRGYFRVETLSQGCRGSWRPRPKIYDFSFSVLYKEHWEDT
jgi:hypothetical protein